MTWFNVATLALTEPDMSSSSLDNETDILVWIQELLKHLVGLVKLDE